MVEPNFHGVARIFMHSRMSSNRQAFTGLSERFVITLHLYQHGKILDRLILYILHDKISPTILYLSQVCGKFD